MRFKIAYLMNLTTGRVEAINLVADYYRYRWLKQWGWREVVKIQGKWVEFS